MAPIVQISIPSAVTVVPGFEIKVVVKGVGLA
jgi:hypothetical protein